MGPDSAQSANDERVKFPVESSIENKTSDSPAEFPGSAFETAAVETLFHMSGVKAYLEYYELR